MKIIFSAFVLLTVMLSTNIWSQTYNDLDPRIRNHYTESDYNAMVTYGPNKLEKVIFLYTQSFTVINPSCTNCMVIQNSDIDISVYEHFRKQSERFRVGLNRNGDMLELISKDELQAAFTNIDNN